MRFFICISYLATTVNSCIRPDNERKTACTNHRRTVVDYAVLFILVLWYYQVLQYLSHYH